MLTFVKTGYPGRDRHGFLHPLMDESDNSCFVLLDSLTFAEAPTFFVSWSQSCSVFFLTLADKSELINKKEI